jgi:hypothetical protein
MTKSGQMGGNPVRCLGVRAAHRSSFTHAAFGDLSAPLGKLKIVEELNTFPSLVCRFQLAKSVINSASLFPLSPPTGDMIINSP